MSSGRGIYSIGAIGRMLGLSQATIRSWEDRYGVVVAERSGGGRRIYTRDQLEQLRFVKARIDEGLSAADAHRLLAEHQAVREPPVQQGHQAVREPLVQHRPAEPDVGPLVLLADSDRYAAQLNEYFLRAEGYNVEIALSADEAEEKFTAEEPALTIVELMISGGIGRQLCERLKQRRHTPLLTISSLDLREQALAAGADAFLQKPCEPRRVVSTVRDLLGRGGPARDNQRPSDG